MKTFIDIRYRYRQMSWGKGVRCKLTYLHVMAMVINAIRWLGVVLLADAKSIEKTSWFSCWSCILVELWLYQEDGWDLIEAHKKIHKVKISFTSTPVGIPWSTGPSCRSFIQDWQSSEHCEHWRNKNRKWGRTHLSCHLPVIRIPTIYYRWFDMINLPGKRAFKH